MLSKLLVAVLATGLVCIIGCSAGRTVKTVPESQSAMTELDSCLEQLAREIVVAPMGAAKYPKVALIEPHQIGVSGTTDLDKHIASGLHRNIEATGQEESVRIKFLKDKLVKSNIEEFALSLDESAVIKDAATWSSMGAQLVVMPMWQITLDGKVRIDVSTIVVQSEAVGSQRIQASIEKNDAVRRLIGERLPGFLVVQSADGNVQFSCDGYSRGRIGDQDQPLELSYGNHLVTFEKPGYSPLSKHIFINEKTSTTIKVAPKEASAAPLGAFTLNALVPGSAALFYGSGIKGKGGAKALNASAALLFYTFATLYVIDLTNQNKKEDYLTEDDWNRYRVYRDIELGAAAGSYVLNLVTGYMLGDADRKRSKKIAEVANVDPSNSLSFGTMVVDNTHCIKLTYSF